MTDSEKRVYKFGGVMGILSGILFFAVNLTTISLPIPPANKTEFMQWLSVHSFAIAMQDEALFFGSVFLIPTVFVLYRLFKNQAPISALMGAGLLGLSIPVLTLLDVILGRLVYPVYDIQLSVDVLQFALTIFHGGMHLVALLYVPGIILIGYAAKGIFPKLYWYVALLAGILQLPFAYPWLAGFALNLFAILFFSAWLILTGVCILSISRKPVS